MGNITKITRETLDEIDKTFELQVAYIIKLLDKLDRQRKELDFADTRHCGCLPKRIDWK